MSERAKSRKPKNRYIVVAGEMGTQEILDTATGKEFYGDAETLINALLKELNRLHDEEVCLCNKAKR